MKRLCVQLVRYIRALGKGVERIGSAIAFRELREQGHSVRASVAGAVANETAGHAILATGAGIGTLIEPGGGTLAFGAFAWVGDLYFGWSDATGERIANEVDSKTGQ